MPPDNPTANEFHEYDFAKRDIHWTQWLNQSGPDDSDGSSDEFIPSEGDETKQEPGESLSSVDLRSRACNMFAESEDDSDSDDNGEMGATNTTTNTTNRILTDADMAHLKRFALTTYPGDRFLQLPQFKRWVSRLSKNKAIAELHKFWNLDQVTARFLRGITRITIEHPAEHVQEILYGACRQVPAPPAQQYTFDIRVALRELDVEVLRGYVVKGFTGMKTEDIIARIVPGGMSNDAFMAEAYGSAVMFGREGGKGFGFDCQQWLDKMGNGPPLP